MSALDAMVRAARAAGQSLTRDFARVSELEVLSKGTSDFVSIADLRAQELIVEELRRAFPNATLVLEEDPGSHGLAGRDAFYVDPLDGTTNFLRGIPHFAVSIGYEREGQLVAGVVFDPVKNELFSAESGAGAWLSGRSPWAGAQAESQQRLTVSKRSALAEAVVGTGIPHRGRGEHPRYVAAFPGIMAEVAGIRRLGSAALDLAYVAAGRFDAFFETELSSWDIAAGVLLVREAAGVVTRCNGKPFELRRGDVLASTPAISSRLHGLLTGLSLSDSAG